MNKKKLLYGVIVAAQILVLIVMIARQENLLANGTKVLLKCAPVDPRSLFSGDYVILNYSISRIPESKKITGTEGKNLSNGDTIYVALKKDAGGKYYEIADYSADLETLKKNYPVVIRGKVDNAWDNSYTINYGIEQYFVPQNKGKEIENDLRDVSVLVSVDEKGSSAVSRLYIQEQEVTFY